jgi:hypothetical protein
VELIAKLAKKEQFRYVTALSRVWLFLQTGTAREKGAGERVLALRKYREAVVFPNEFRLSALHLSYMKKCPLKANISRPHIFSIGLPRTMENKGPNSGILDHVGQT